MYYNTETKKVYGNAQQVMKDFPDVSFPGRAWTDDELSALNLAHLYFPKNLVDDLLPYQEFVETAPTLVGGLWTRTFEKKNKSFSDFTSEQSEVFVATEKARILAEIAKQRYMREISNVSIQVGDTLVSFPVSRETQMSINSVYTTLKNNIVTDTVWKISNDTWINVNLATIELISAAVVQHVQSAFQWEKDKFDIVSQIQTLDDLLEFSTTYPELHPDYYLNK